MSVFQETLASFLEQLSVFKGIADTDGGRRSVARSELEKRWKRLLDTPAETKDDIQALHRAEDAIRDE